MRECACVSVLSHRSLLAEKFKNTSGQSEAMVIGQMLHKIFQATLIKCQESARSLRGELLHQAITKEVRSVVTCLDSLDHL